MDPLASKIALLDKNLRELGSVAVAFSGGVDSTFLLKAARGAVGDRAVGVTGDSASLPRRELDEARELARLIGARHVVLPTEEIDDPDYVKNAGNRCYFCKRELFDQMLDFARREGLRALAYGELLDDRAADRPGRAAAVEVGVRWPLVEAGFTKEDVRAAARAAGLPNWDKPASPCLSSRIPTGGLVTREKLRQIEAAEAAIHNLGFRVVRVRHLGETARVEFGTEDLPRASFPGTFDRITQAVREAGFKSVSVDPNGYRSGGANHVP